MTDTEWEQYVAWWSERWPVIKPDRESIENYLEWIQSKPSIPCTNL